MVLSRVRLIRVRLVLVNLNPINDTYIEPNIFPWGSNLTEKRFVPLVVTMGANESKPGEAQPEDPLGGLLGRLGIHFNPQQSVHGDDDARYLPVSPRSTAPSSAVAQSVRTDAPIHQNMSRIGRTLDGYGQEGGHYLGEAAAPASGNKNTRTRSREKQRYMYM